jgi:nucleotide-binding universal stress UspA family protein
VISASSILVPVNGSVTDPDAVGFACDVARRTKAEVFVIYVIEVKRHLPLDVDLPTEAAAGDGVLAKAEDVAEAAEVRIETELLQARDVGTAIVDEAIERNVDLIVMGLPFKRKFGEYDLGKTAPYVLKNAPCRVMLTRSAPTAAQATPNPGAAHSYP